MSGPKRSKVQREDDLRRITHLLLQGMLQREIADEMGITQQQVSYDLKVIKRRWREESVKDMEIMINQELDRISTLEREYWAAWRKSKKDKTRARQQMAEDVITGRSVERITENGDPRFLQGVERCIERRSELLGLDAAKKQDIIVRDEREDAHIKHYDNLSVDEKKTMLELKKKAMGIE